MALKYRTYREYQEDLWAKAVAAIVATLFLLSLFLFSSFLVSEFLFSLGEVTAEFADPDPLYTVLGFAGMLITPFITRTAYRFCHSRRHLILDTILILLGLAILPAMGYAAYWFVFIELPRSR